MLLSGAMEREPVLKAQKKRRKTFEKKNLQQGLIAKCLESSDIVRYEHRLNSVLLQSMFFFPHNKQSYHH